MTIWISREFPLFNFERLDILCAWTGLLTQKFWPLKFLESSRCSISSVSICYGLESGIRVKSYDHLNFSRASVFPFRVSRYMMRLNRTSESKVMTIWTSWQLTLFHFERHEILCAWTGNPSEMLWPFEFLESFSCPISSVSIYYLPESDIRLKSYDHLNFTRASIAQFRASRYVLGLNRTSEWKVMTILNFSIASVVQFLASRYIMSPNRTSVWKLWPFQFLESFRCSISSVSIYYANESDIQIKGYDHLNFSRASVVLLLASLYVMRMNRTSELKVRTIWISEEVPLFNFERPDIL